MSGKGGAKAADAPDERLVAQHKALEKKNATVYKALMKKLKLKATEMQALSNVLIEADLAYQLQEEHQLPVKLDEKLGAVHELLTLADSRTFDKTSVEDLLAFLKEIPPLDLAEKFLNAGPRVLYLEKLSLAMCGLFTYIQATSPYFGPRLKRAGDVLARMVPGATFAKAWRPKPAPSILTKLYHRRGQVMNGWLTDALQGRITCASPENVESLTEWFQDVLSTQARTADDNERNTLSANPTGAEIINYDLSGLVDEDTERPIDGLATFCEGVMTPEDTAALEGAKIIVYRVKQCSCCTEVEGMDEQPVMLVNLLVIRPCARRAGAIWKLPEGELAVTMEIQISTAEGFKMMKKGADAHDRELMFARFPLLNKLNELASGSEGKLTMPGAGKGGVRKGGDPAEGKNMMNMFGAVDLMHPSVPGAEVRTHQGTVPAAPEEFKLHSRDRTSQGSRWFNLWQSTPGTSVVTIEYVGLKMSAKIPPSTGFSVLIGGVTDQGNVIHVAEEKVASLVASKGELVLVSDGQTPSGQVLGNLLKYEKVIVDLFEPDRGSQMIPLAEANIRVLERGPACMDPELETADNSQTVPVPYEHAAGG